jgi:small subunit ribosomal protein S19e
MASFTPRNVRDVPAEEFIRAYAAHLKANDKVSAQLLASPS